MKSPFLRTVAVVIASSTLIGTSAFPEKALAAESAEEVCALVPELED